LLRLFFAAHDPTTLNRQGADIGTQYRSAIFVHDTTQRATAEQVIAEMTPLWDAPIVTEITDFTAFWEAEPYHHNYFATHPDQGYCAAVIAPKVAKFRSRFASRLKSA
jgi:peptide-methionine (S)-S-oxide reductase